MTIDPRVALQTLVSALEEHLAAAASRRGDEDPIVESAYLAIADAFEVYEEALFDAYSEVTPLIIYDEDEEDDGEDDESGDGDREDAFSDEDDSGGGDDLEVIPNP